MTSDVSWGTCLIIEGGLHSSRWYSGEACCACGDPAAPVLDVSFLYVNFGPEGVSTVWRNNSSGEVVQIPGGSYEVIDRG